MDIPKNGESSRSPTQGAAAARGALILPEWDVLPEKHLHSSLDLISLLHLDGLYMTYVRPYFDPIPETDDEGNEKPVRQKKKQGLSKGYQNMLEDCIDPVPAGENAPPALLPLIGDMMEPPRPLPQLFEDALVPLPEAALGSARLEVGLKTEGYAGGEKMGVREAEEKRRRKKARMSQSVAPDLPELPGPGPGGALPSPAPPSRPGRPFTPGAGQRRPPFGTPGMKPPFPRASAPPGFRPGTPSGRPGTPGARPGTPGAAPGTPNYVPRASAGTPGTPAKRPGSEQPHGAVKRFKQGGGSRSASPADVGVRAVFKR